MAENQQVENLRVLIFCSFLALLAFVIWNFVTFYLFPPTKNEIAYQLDIPTLQEQRHF